MHLRLFSAERLPRRRPGGFEASRLSARRHGLSAHFTTIFNLSSLIVKTLLPSTPQHFYLLADQHIRSDCFPNLTSIELDHLLSCPLEQVFDLHQFRLASPWVALRPLFNDEQGVVDAFVVGRKQGGSD